MMTKKTIRNIVLVLVVVVLTAYADYVVLWPRQVSEDLATINLPKYSAEELKRYDGTDPQKPILLALDGLVYDVSLGGDDFYKPGESYHYLVGVDSSRYLHIYGENLIRKKYPVVGRYIE